MFKSSVSSSSKSLSSDDNSAVTLFRCVCKERPISPLVVDMTAGSVWGSCCCMDCNVGMTLLLTASHKLLTIFQVGELFLFCSNSFG